MPLAKPQIFPLTSLRFFAAMMVVAHHYWEFQAGYAGVGFFFVLSGFVLAINYPTVEKVSFWWKRFARIYPLHVLAFFFAVPLGGTILDLLPSLFLLQSWIPIRSFNFAGNGPSWSISDEAFFYAVFPFLLKIRTQVVMLWGIGLVAAVALWTVELPLWTLSQGGAVFLLNRSFETPLTHWTFYIFPPTRLFEFGLGMYLSKLPGRVGTKAEVAAIVLAVGSIVALPLWAPAVGAALFFIPASAALVYVFSRSDGPIALLLSNKGLVLLGDASFALYMIHFPLGAYLGHSLGVASLGIGLSILVFLYIERPAQKWLLSVQPGGQKLD